MSKETNLITQEEEIAEAIGERTALTPPVDIFESPDEFLLVTDVPGVVNDNVKIHLEDDRLTLIAIRSEDTAYRRSFLMPEGVDSAKTDAKLASGVLTIHLPKVSAVKPRRITVRSA